MLLDNTAFLTQLTRLFDKTKTQGTVFVTMRRNSFDVERERRKARKGIKPKGGAGNTPGDTQMKDATRPVDEVDTTEYPCLIRAVSGKSKISTMVSSHDETRFLEEYGTIVRVHMDTMKKKDRKKQRREAKERKAKQRAAKTAPKKADETI